MEGISILIPTYNEEKFIKSCLGSVFKFSGLSNIDYEIIIIDGCSSDHTKEIINEFIKINKRIVLLENSKTDQSSSLNIGINKSKYKYIMRLDAHCVYPEDYLEQLLRLSVKTNADNVGGKFVTLAGGSGYGAQLVQSLITHRFGIGNSDFRVGNKEGITDTVPFGFFRKVIFERIGLFDERLKRCQDFEFNKRIKKNGGTIWMNPTIRIQYFSNPSLAKFLIKQITKQGPYVVYMWYLHRYTFSIRHAVPAVFVLTNIIALFLSFFFTWAKYILLFIISVYLLFSLIASIQQAIRYRKPQLVLVLPALFFVFHFLHGTGICVGGLKLLIHKAPFQN